MINKSDSRCAVVRFCYHSYDYRLNWTPLSPITITYLCSRQYVAQFLFQLALWKKIFFDVDVVVKYKLKCGLSLSVLLSTTSKRRYSFPNFVRIVSACSASLQTVLKRKSDEYKQLICIMQRMHFQVRVGVFSFHDKYLFRCLWCCGKKQIECG